MATIQPFFPYTPDYMSWDDWNGNMAVFYDSQAIPFNSEENWRLTADFIAGNAAFSAYPVPTSDKFEDWQSWASQFTQSINGQSY